MRKLNLFLIIIIGAALFSSCKKDEVRAVLSAHMTAPALTAGVTDGSTVVFSQANKNVLLSIIWSPASYGFRASVTYTLQMDKKGNNFAAPVSVGTPTSTKLTSADTATLITNDLNNTLLLLQADPENPKATAVEFRVKAYINDSVPVLYSPVVGVTYTPYFIPIIYNKVYVPGDYQGWSPTTAPYMASLDGGPKYEGYINFTTNGGFKITPLQDWSTAYGAGTTAGSISTTGSNMTLAGGVGYYKVNANTSELTITTLLITAWSVIGDVTAPGYNWSNDMNLTYNATTNLWVGTADLHAGQYKFRANHDWGLNYGMGAVAGKLDPAGPNIVLPAAGNYTITLNLGNPPIYRYTIVKN